MVSNTYYVVFLLCFSSFYVECSFFFIAPSVFSNVYLNLSLFIEVSVSSQEVSSHVYVRGIDYGAVSVISLLGRKSSDSVVFFHFIGIRPTHN